MSGLRLLLWLMVVVVVSRLFMVCSVRCCMWCGCWRNLLRFDWFWLMFDLVECFVEVGLGWCVGVLDVGSGFY